MKLAYHNDRFDNALLNKSVSEILAANTLMSMATVKKGQSYINTAYYAYNNELEIFFLSPPKSQHCLHLKNEPSVALSIYDSHQDWTKEKRGLQLFGTCQPVNALELLEAGRLYAGRFVGFKEILPSIKDIAKVMESRFYKVETKSLQIFDEVLLEEDLFLFIDRFSKG
ncbi:MAG: pyridoxamine 5'-phosphate oxidase family protein [Bdellovibrionales bacterium]